MMLKKQFIVIYLYQIQCEEKIIWIQIQFNVKNLFDNIYLIAIHCKNMRNFGCLTDKDIIN